MKLSEKIQFSSYKKGFKDLMNQNTFILKLNNWITKAAVVSGHISGIVIASLMFLVFADVFGRYVLNHPIKGNHDMVVMLMVVSIFLSVGFTQSQNSHVGVELLYSKFSNRIKIILDLFNYFFGAMIYGLMSWLLIQRAFYALFSTKPQPTTLILFIPHSPFILIAGIGTLILCLLLISNFLLCINRLINYREII